MANLRTVAEQWILRMGVVLALGTVHTAAAEPQEQTSDSSERTVQFELTYANRDLIWLGDPASPAASAYPRPGARPIATDFCVLTRSVSNVSPARRYMREARLVENDGTRTVYAFTENREKVIGTVDHEGHFQPNEFYRNNRQLLPTWPKDAATLAYDADANALYYAVEVPGPVVSESLDFLPLDVTNTAGNEIGGRFSIEFMPATATDESIVRLDLLRDDESTVLAKTTVPSVFRRGELQLGSFDNNSGTYQPEAVYRAGARAAPRAEPSVTVTLAGEFTSAVECSGESLIVVEGDRAGTPSDTAPAPIAIDGNFDDWRNVTGVDDPRGDLAPYLEYVPDVDLLEFKVAHDDEHIYLYARVAGQVGRSHPDGGRGYFYAYMDVDQNAGTGFLPSRDDDCYFGVDIGDDCEVQFEFVNNSFRKAFYGFCGLGGNDNVLKQQLTLGKSQYGRIDEQGNERKNYKAEYIYRDGITEITEDLKLGTSDTIRVAISPDGSEVEVASAFTGFLKDPQGRPTLGIGQTIDLAVGMECDSKAYLGKSRWAADSTPAIREYFLRPIASQPTGAD